MKELMENIETEEEFNDAELKVPEGMAKFLSTVLNTTIKLTKLIVEVRLNNGAKLKDHDVYQIYEASFKKVMVDLERSDYVM